MADLGLTTQLAVTAEDLTSLTPDPSLNWTTSEAVNLQWKTFPYINISIRLVMGLLAASGNLLTVVAIGHYEYLRSCTNYLIVALAIADMLGGFVSILLFFNYLTPMSYGTWMSCCTLETYLNLLSSGMNIVYIALIAVDRCIFILFPLRYYSLVTPRLIAGAVLVPASLAVIQMVTIHFVINQYRHPLGRICRGIFPRFVLPSINMWFYVCMPITILMYTRIAWTAYRQSRAIEQLQNVAANREHKITKMLSLVLGVYMGCYLPQYTVYAMESYFTPENFVIIERVASWLWWVNSWSNPFIYAWKNKEFKKAFRSLLGLKNPTIDPLATNPTA